MRISVKEKEIFTPMSANSITQYSFTECLALLNKLQHLDSLVLQSAYYQYIIQVLEERLKRLAQSKPHYVPSSFTGQTARATV
jgi:hypothetical protein